MTERIIKTFGISTALLTPFHADGGLNLPLLCEHANDVLRQGTHGVTLFGTTGEGASIGSSERTEAIRALCDSGLPVGAITLGVGGPAVQDVLSQVTQGADLGITQFLLLPPFYFKGVDDDGLFRWHASLFETAGHRARFILYHIPQITQIPLSVDLILRLHRAFPERVLAVKDSSGQWDNTRALLECDGPPILVGDERLLHKALPMGAAGSICGMANLHPARLRRLFDTHAEDADLSSEVDLIVSGPVIPALKQAMVTLTGNADWGNLRPPLGPLGAEAKAAITARFRDTEDVS